MRIICVLLLLLVAGAAGFSQDGAEQPGLAAADGAAIAERWGVELQRLRVTAGGYMLDFRLRVTDATKAAPLFVRQTKPVLVDESTGSKLVIPVMPKVGALRSSNTPEEGRIYGMLFANPGRFLKAGAAATIIIGDFKIEHLSVE